MSDKKIRIFLDGEPVTLEFVKKDGSSVSITGVISEFGMEQPRYSLARLYLSYRAGLNFGGFSETQKV